MLSFWGKACKFYQDFSIPKYRNLSSLRCRIPHKMPSGLTRKETVQCSRTDRSSNDAALHVSLVLGQICAPGTKVRSATAGHGSCTDLPALVHSTLPLISFCKCWTDLELPKSPLMGTSKCYFPKGHLKGFPLLFSSIRTI